MKVVTAGQMATLERASERRGVSTDTLMENAGLAVARAVRRQLGRVAGSQGLGPGWTRATTGRMDWWLLVTCSVGEVESVPTWSRAGRPQTQKWTWPGLTE